MAKRTSHAPYDPNVPLAPEDATENANAASAAPQPPAIRTVNFDVPVFADEIHGHCSQHVDIRLNPREAELLRRITLALDAQAARHVTGRLIQGERSGDTLHWLLGHLAERWQRIKSA